MKIHISGSRGYIGSAITKKLQTSNDISESDKDTLDVLEFEKLAKALEFEKPDIVIALAGIMGAQVSKNNLFETFQVNSIGILNVLEAMKRANVKNLIFFSSQTVYGPSKKGIFSDEESMNNPMHPYATSKVVSEYFIKEYSRNFGINAIILQPSIVVGNFDGEPNSLNEFVQNALNDEAIIIFGEGSHQREYLSLSDMVGAVEKAVNFLDKNNEKGIFERVIISSNESISMVDLANKIVGKVKKGSVEHIDKTSRAFSICSKTDKANKLLQWKITQNLNSILDNTIRILK